MMHGFLDWRRRLTRWISGAVASLLLCAGAVTSASAQSNAPVPAPVLPATLDQRAFLQILALRNTEVRYSRIGADVAARMRDAEAGLYEPVMFGTVRLERRDRQRTFEERLQNLQTAGTSVLDEQVVLHEFGVRNKLSSGGEASASYRTTARRNNLIALSQASSEYSNALVLSFKQPLLRGFGRAVTETDREIAELEHQAALVQVQQQLFKAGADGLAIYWQAYKAQETVHRRQEAMDNTRRLITDTQARIEAGRAPAAALLELRSVQLNRESELLRSRQALLEAQGRLMTALDIRYAVSPEPLELRPQWSTPEVVRREVGPQDDAQMQSALSSWAPLQLAEFKRRQAELRLRFAANQMEPMVDLVVSYSTTGLANRRGLATDLTGSTKYPDWFVGLSMELPAYGNQKSQAQYLAQAGRRDQAELEIAALRLSFANDINARWQDLVNAVAVLENGAVDFALREQIESVEKERYRLGMGSLNAVIQKESEVIEARLRTLDNQVRFEVALATWRYLKGELMADAGITIN
jgi:outer membrane protein TolC